MKLLFLVLTVHELVQANVRWCCIVHGLVVAQDLAALRRSWTVNSQLLWDRLPTERKHGLDDLRELLENCDVYFEFAKQLVHDLFSVFIYENPRVLAAILVKQHAKFFLKILLVIVTAEHCFVLDVFAPASFLGHLARHALLP